MPTLWTKDACEKGVEILQASKTCQDALKRLSKVFGRNITRHALIHAFRLNGFSPPSAYLRDSPLEAAPVNDPDIQELVAVVRKKNHSLHSLCDVLDKSPKAVQQLIKRAEKEGYSIGLLNDQVAFKLPPTRIDEVTLRRTDAKPGAPLQIAVVSDLHFGSKYNLGSRMQQFVEQAYKEGIRDVFCPGDVLEGCYSHAQWELSHHSWEEQAESFLTTFPELPGLRFHFIDGNHDWTWTDKNGMESGRALVALAKSRGRSDLRYYGSRGALINYEGTRIELWHPKKGMGYAKSYPLQNHIRDTHPKRMPDILLAGHWHQYVKLHQQNTWAFACGTFQHGDTPYGRSLGGDTAVGGLTMKWRKDDDGILRRLSDEFHVMDYEAPAHTT